MGSGSGTGTPVTTTEPVSLTEAKRALRVDIDDDDALIEFYISAARSYIERICRPMLQMLTKACTYTADTFPDSDTLELTPYPLQSVTAVVYVDSDGVSHTISASDYVVDTVSEPGRIRLKATASWPSATLREVNGFQVNFVAGYGASGASVPHELRQAILLLVGHQYENREPIVVTGAMPKSLEFTVMALLGPWRREV